MAGRFTELLLEHAEQSEKQSSQIKEPRKFKVLIINDDYTPMAFVVEVLMRFFNMNETRATQVMLQVHHQGKGVCGVFTKDIAETKAVQVNRFAQQSEHPLLCGVEPLT